MEKGGGLGPNPSEEQHPLFWGLLPLAKRKDHVSGEKDAQICRTAGALHGFLQEEGADLCISHQSCPHLQEMPQSQPWLLSVWFQGELSLKAGALSPIKSIIAS